MALPYFGHAQLRRLPATAGDRNWACAKWRWGNKRSGTVSGLFFLFFPILPFIIYIYISSFVFHLLIIFLSFLSVRPIYSSELCLECMLLLSCLEGFTMLVVVVSFFSSIWPLFGFQGLRASWMRCQLFWIPNFWIPSSLSRAFIVVGSNVGSWLVCGPPPPLTISGLSLK